jgi:uncharacterized RDD family membrane protein YckC
VDAQHGLVTPEAVALDLETATVGSRGAAYLLDLVVLASGYLLIGIATALLGGGGFVPGWAGIAALLLLGFAWQFGYPIGFETLWRGRTPGKAAMGLRVVTDEGAPVGLRHAAIRATVAIFELLALLGLPAVITSLVSPRGQRLGDLAAGTVVIRERRAGGRTEAATFPAPAGAEAYVERLDVHGLGPADYATLRDALHRLPQLPDEGTRRRVAAQVARSLLDRVAPPPPQGMPAEVWLRCVAAAVQRRRGDARPAPASPPGTAPASPRSGPPPAPAGPPAPADPPATRRPEGPPPPGDGFQPPA